MLSVDAERERISLGIKQLQGDSFNDYISINKKGAKVKAKVISFNEEKIILSLADQVEGVLSQKDFLNSSSEMKLEEGMELEVLIANINSSDREIILSLRALEKSEQKDALKQNIQRNKEIEDASKSNFGDLIKAELEEKEDE